MYIPDVHHDHNLDYAANVDSGPLDSLWKLESLRVEQETVVPSVTKLFGPAIVLRCGKMSLFYKTHHVFWHIKII